MGKKLVSIVLVALFLGFITSNNLVTSENLIENSLPNRSVNSGISEFNPIAVTNDIIDMNINFSATQRQIWFEISPQSKSTWINQTITSSPNVNFYYRAHTSYAECISGTHNTGGWWNNEGTSSSSDICNNPSSDNRILLVIYASESYFLHVNGTINNDILLPLSISFSVRGYQDPVIEPPTPPNTNQYGDGFTDRDSQSFSPVVWNNSKIFQQMDIDIGEISETTGTDSISGYLEDSSDSSDHVIMGDWSFARVNLTYPSDDNYSISAPGCAYGLIPESSTGYLDCVESNNIQLSINKNALGTYGLEGYLTNELLGANYTFDEIVSDTGNYWTMYYDSSTEYLEISSWWYGVYLFNSSSGTNNGSGGWYFTITKNLNDILFPMRWEVTASVEQLHPLESYIDYDTPSDFNQINGYIQHEKDFSGRIDNRYDIDSYHGIIEHGHETVIEVTSDNSLLLEVLPNGVRSETAHCSNEGGLVTEPNSFKTEAAKKTTITCKSEFFTDTIPFKIKFNQSEINQIQPISPPIPDPNTGQYFANYTFKITKGKAYSLPEVSDGGGIYSDAPPDYLAFGEEISGSLPVPLQEIFPRMAKPQLQTAGLGYTNGTFLHASDNVDFYQLEDPSNIISLGSYCASINYITTTIFSVNRINLVNGIPVDLLNRCDYAILVKENTDTEYTNPNPSGDRLSFSESITIPEFNPSAPLSEYFAVDVYPTLGGKIIATQDSGNEINIQHMNQQAINELEFSQSISIDKSVYQVANIIVSGLDGSRVTITLEPYSTSSITTESNLLMGNGYGRLGVSNDEGFDYQDVWQVDVNDLPSYWSVKMVSKSDDFDVSINSMMSRSRCTSSTPELNTVSIGTSGNMKQTGDYQIVLNKYYNGCPNFDIISRSSVSPNSSVIVDFSLGGNELPLALKYNLYNQDYEPISTSEFIQTSDQRAIINIPGSTTNTRYHLLAEDSNGVVFDEHIYNVVNTPYVTVNHANSGQYSMLVDLGDKATISVVGRDYNTGSPEAWELMNMTWHGYDSQGSQFLIEAVEDSVEGSGSEIVTINYPKDLNQGDMFTLEGKLISRDLSYDFSLDYFKPGFTTNLDCQDTFMLDYTEPRNDFLCTVQIKHGYSLNNEYLFDDIKIEGYLELYSKNLNLLDNISFTTDNNGFENIRIPVSNYLIGDYYYVKIGLEDDFGVLNGDNSVEIVMIEIEQSNQSTEQTNSEFDLTLIPLRITALPGDSVDINWQVTGNNISSLYWALYAGNEIYDVKTLMLDDLNAQAGSFEVELPDNDNLDMSFTLLVSAYSIYGELSTDSIILYGADLSTEVYLQIEPRKPIPGNDFSVEFEIPNAEDWISWSYELRGTYSSNPSVLSLISADSGFNDENSGSVDIFLPFNQYVAGSIYIQLDFEIKDGSTYSIAEYIETQSYREMQVESNDIAVLGKDYAVEWSVVGENLNSADEVDTISFYLSNLIDGSREFEEVIIQDGKSGKFTVDIPKHLDTGTHTLVINFEFIDGTSESYVRLINIDPEPKGINFLGLNIPSVPYGFDTLIAIFLLANVIILHVKLRKKETSIGNDFDSADDNEDYPEEYQDSEQKDLYDYVVNDLNTQYNPLPIYSSPPIDSVGVVDAQGYEWVDFSGKQWYREKTVGGSWNEWKN